MKIKRREPLLVQSGLVLGLLAIGNLVGSWSQILRYFFAGLAVLFFIHLIFGMVSYRKLVKNQLRDPLIASVFPTFFMQGMLISSYLASWTFLGAWTMFLASFDWSNSIDGLLHLFICYSLQVGKYLSFLDCSICRNWRSSFDNFCNSSILARTDNLLVLSSCYHSSFANCFL